MSTQASASTLHVHSNPCKPKKLVVSDDFERIAQQMGSDWHWRWIRSRIYMMWEDWVAGVTKLLSNQSLIAKYNKKKILVYPSMLTNTNFARESSYAHGGPLGDLLEWADLIAALFVMGHDVRLVYNIDGFITWVNKYPNEQVRYSADCDKLPYDLIYTDIGGFLGIPTSVKESYKCKYRINDIYGTQAMFNDPTFSRTHPKFDSPFGKLGLHLKQFYTLYPHTPDNSFLGFAVPMSKTVLYEKQNYAILYGKKAKYFEGKGAYLQTIMQLVGVHATLPRGQSDVLPPDVINHGIVSQHEYQKLFSMAKIVVGVELPPEGTGVLEAFARGSAFLTVTYKGEYINMYKGKPTSRQIHNQNPYLEMFVGPPYYNVVDGSNATQVTEKIKELLAFQLQPFVPYEFTTEGYLQRMAVYIQLQNFCPSQPKAKVWPPLAALIPVLGKPGQSCSDACFQNGLFCEPVYFPTLNDKDFIARMNMTCGTTEESQDDVIYPAFHKSSSSCVLQLRTILFSCDIASVHYIRLCPCRDYIKHQVALCKQCITNT